jgi:hypothetical protein
MGAPVFVGKNKRWTAQEAREMHEKGPIDGAPYMPSVLQLQQTAARISREERKLRGVE